MVQVEENVLANKISLAQTMFRAGFPVTFSKPGTKACAFCGWATAKDEGEIEKYLRGHPDSNAMLLTDGFIVVDVDRGHSSGQDGYETLREWELANGHLPDTWTVITGKGGLHYYYKRPPMEASVRCRSGVLEAVDIRADGGLVLAPGSVHPETGRVYEFECGFSPDDIDITEADSTVTKLSRWGLDAKDNPFVVPETIPKGKRHDVLLSMASSMRAKGYALSSTLAAVKEENSARCTPPYAESDVEGLVLDVFNRYPSGRNAKPKHDDQDGQQAQQPKHIGLTQAMLDQGFAFVNDMPCMPVEGGFEFGWDAVHRAMLRHDPWCVDRTRKEAIRTLSYEGIDTPAANPRYIEFRNGILDVKTMRFLTRDEFLSLGAGIVPVVIPHDYNPSASPCEAVETLLDGVSCNNEQIRMNLEEFVGLSMSRYADSRSSAIWAYGVGENGKSTLWEAVAFVVGKRNMCSLELDDLKGQFNTQMLVGKLLAVFDDQIANSVDKSVIGKVKRIVTGQPIKIEQKGKDPYNATMFCTLFVTSNEPPQLSDTTHGSLRRWHMIPLNADFRDSKDIDLREKLMTEDAAQWLIRLGVEGLRRVIKNDGMTVTDYSRTALREAKERSNSVYAFLSEHPREEILAQPNVEVWFWKYQEATKDKGGRPFEQSKFTQMVNTEYNLKTANAGRYKVGDYDIGVGGLARLHGRIPGEKFRVFVEK